MSAPTSGAIAAAVSSGLKTSAGLTPSLVPTVTFFPTLGIVAARMNTLGLMLESFKVPLTRSIQSVMMPSIGTNFDVQGRPRWASLSDATLQRREQAGFSDGPILERTGNLRDAATSVDIWDIQDKSAVVRDLPADVQYGKVHQGGYAGSTMAGLIAKHGGDISAANAAHTASITSAISSGTTISQGAAPIPARPFLDIQEADNIKILEIFTVWLAEKCEEAWPSI